jgi:hypothetical protein
MSTPDVIPYTFAPCARDFIEHLTALQEEAGKYLDLSETIGAGREFKAAAERLTAAPINDVARLNTGLKQLTRIVNPALYTIDGPYEFDPALQLPVLPGLAPMRDLARLDPRSDDFAFLLTKLRRQRNRIEDALVQAMELATRLAR